VFYSARRSGRRPRFGGGFRSRLWLLAAARGGEAGSTWTGGGFWRETSAAAPKTQNFPRSHGRAGRATHHQATTPTSRQASRQPLAALAGQNCRGDGWYFWKWNDPKSAALFRFSADHFSCSLQTVHLDLEGRIWFLINCSRFIFVSKFKSTS
jgi:hypothetical protein